MFIAEYGVSLVRHFPSIRIRSEPDLRGADIPPPKVVVGRVVVGRAD